MIVDDQITSGRLLRLEIERADMPAPTWSMTFVLRGPANVTLNSTADGSDHVITETIANTSSWIAGWYDYEITATDGTEVVSVECGRVEIVKALELITTPYDARTHSRRVYEAICAVIEKRASLDQESYKINNRELKRMSIDDLMKLKTHYKNKMLVDEGKGSLIAMHKLRFQ